MRSLLPRSFPALIVSGILILLPGNFLFAFAFIFAGATNLDIIAHPMGYTGVGGVINISVGIDPTSVNAADMVGPTLNVITTFNNLTPTNGNLLLGASNNIPLNSQYDFESVLLHEMGHSLGLAHCNAATESLLTGNDRNYTKATSGANGTFDIDPGADAIIGSADDVRGDDENLNWFRISNNDPFTIPATVDITTYSRDLADLPGGDLFSSNADRTVGAALGYANSEAVMQQATFNDEAQRTLGHDDVAGLMLAMAGVDGIAGTGDDYTFNLTYAGLTTAADMVIDFDNGQTGFAVSSSNGTFINATHIRITATSLYFNDGFNWFFNSSPLPVELISFEAHDENGHAHLIWETAHESGHDYFEIERSIDGQSWQSAGTVKSANSASGSSYDFVDRNYGQYGNEILYQIRFVDLDGAVSMSPIRTLSYVSPVVASLSLSPNPLTVASELRLELPYDVLITWQLHSIDGKRIHKATVPGKKGLNALAVGQQLSLVPGVYLLKVQYGDQLQVLKLVQQ